MKRLRDRLYYRNQVFLNIIAILIYSALVLVIINPQFKYALTYLPIYLCIVLCSIPAYLITDYVIIPRLLYRKKFLQLLVGVILTILLSAVFTTLATFWTYKYLSLENTESIGTFMEVLQSDPGQIFYPFYIYGWNFILYVFTNGAIRIFFSRKNLEFQAANIESKKLESEMTYLRNQLNPDFLIAMLEILKGQIRDEKEDVNSAVDTFTNLLQYQLYQCSKDIIEIEKELLYIKSYIQVQSKRLDEGSDIQLIIGSGMTGFSIPPLMVLPLIENAFKHISHYPSPEMNKIHINIYKSRASTLNITVKNTYEEKVESIFKSDTKSGVGLVNLRRRLELLCPNKFTFNSSISDGIYNTSLILIL
ncbi:MAG: histidine kinase [Saprospiraceae bacterium]|nr:histidine kinase [Saprospiraceae bacterium]